MLKKRLIPADLHSYYLKWLQYYLDYCSKYYLPETSSRSLQQFFQKLLEKKQTEQDRKRDKEPAGFLNKGMLQYSNSVLQLNDLLEIPIIP